MPQDPQTTQADWFSQNAPIAAQGGDWFSQNAPAAIDAPGPIQLSNPSTVPNARIRNLPNPAANEPDPLTALYHGAKTGATLAMLPASAELPSMSLKQIVGMLGGGIVGGAAGQTISKAAGAGPLGQEMSTDAGTLAGSGIGAKIAESPLAKLIVTKAWKTADAASFDRLGKIWDIFKTLPADVRGALDKSVGDAIEPDATGENKPYAGEPSPQPPKWNAHDATGENKPFAGGMDEWRPKSGANPVSDPLGPLRSAPTPEQLQAAQPKPKIKLTNDPLLNRVILSAAKIQADEAATSAVKANSDDLTQEWLEALQDLRGKKARAVSP